MTLREKVADAIWDEFCPAIGQTAEDKAFYSTVADATLAATTDFVASDTDTAHAVAQFTSLRQAAGETPIQFVRRIVSAYLTEAASPACQG